MSKQLTARLRESAQVADLRQDDAVRGVQAQCFRHIPLIADLALHPWFKHLTRAQMRILLDHSCVEVFLSTGEVLATRVYRGRPPVGADAGLDLVAFGGVARVERLEAWEMGAHPHVTGLGLGMFLVARGGIVCVKLEAASGWRP